jgi:hypothetical protein
LLRLPVSGEAFFIFRSGKWFGSSVLPSAQGKLMQTLTPEFFNALIVIVIVAGLSLAALRFYRDMTRTLPPQYTDEEYVAYLKERLANDQARETKTS